MYVYYSEEEYNAEIHGRRLSWSGPERTFRRAKRAWMVLLAVCGFAFAILLVSATIMNRFKGAAQTWADFLGVAVACLACVQWIPQTWTTWNLKSLGSLSLLSLCLMTPVGKRRRMGMLAILEDLLIGMLVHVDIRNQHGHPGGLRRLECLDRLYPGRNNAGRLDHHGYCLCHPGL